MISTARWGVTALNSVVMVWLGLSCQGLILASSALMVSGSRVKASVVRSIRDRSAVGVLRTTLLRVTCPLLIRSHKAGVVAQQLEEVLVLAGDVVQIRPRPLLQHLPLGPIGQNVAGMIHLGVGAALGLVLFQRDPTRSKMDGTLRPSSIGQETACALRHHRLARVDPDTSGAH